MNDPTPSQAVTEMIEYGEAAALQILDDMTDDECNLMIVTGKQ